MVCNTPHQINKSFSAKRRYKKDHFALKAVTYIGEIEGESHREPRGESTVTCRYIGEGNMGHMGLTLWALTVVMGKRLETAC